MKSEMISKNERLIDFLYILVRDHLPIGTVEGIMWDQVDDEKSSYCNSYLEEYVRELEFRLTNTRVPVTCWKHMYKYGDHKWYIDLKGNRHE